ncbi:unnamed protein product [Acanthoscelides obtectus]|uniref:Uncharacterized protein n=1 Tax=Acanthoscelides obtectus TaxID=200917 RepID=A0A9P0KH91_ACAOB|nr:unnamed protein product [Acanthoscelides obtectus]CAK1620581.1 hypothetical protein AOBTE_LOCUS458 [Acanthoscelides obtectus]
MFPRLNIVLKMTLFSACVTLFSCVIYLSYVFGVGSYGTLDEEDDFGYISSTHARELIDRLVKEIPERVSHQSGPTYDIPLNPFDISGKVQVAHAVVRDLNKIKITDFSYNEDTKVLQAVAHFEKIALSMAVQNDLEWNGKKNKDLTAMRLDLYNCNLKVTGHFNGAEVWDTFAEADLGSSKVYIMKIFRNASLSQEISDYLRRNLPRMISANRNLVSTVLTQWTEKGVNSLLKKMDRNKREKQ